MIGMGEHSNCKVPASIAQNLLEFFSRRDPKPMRIDELMAALNIKKKHKQSFTRHLKDLVSKGVIVKLKRKRFAVNVNSSLFTGTISFFRNGSAIVRNKNTNRQLTIHRRKTGPAFAGDEVLVRVCDRGSHRPHRNSVEAEVIRVVRRNCSTVVGILRKRRSVYFVQPQRSDISGDIIIQDPRNAKLGDRVVVQLLTDDSSVFPTGDIIEVMGPSAEPTSDTLSVIRSYHLRTTFPADVIKQAEAISIEESNLENRLDLRKETVFTIDPETANDFDDAISFEKISHDKCRLGVHIADVSDFIPLGSPLDKEAIRRGNSVYFPDTVIPMLPEHLSNGICSLKNHVTRLTISVLMTLDNDAIPVEVEIRESAIRSRYRLNYGQVQSALDLPDGLALPEAGLDEQSVTTLKQVNRLARRLRKRRFENGALNMDIPEIQFSIGGDGRINSIVPSRNDEAHQLVEECMLLANETVCKELAKRKIPQLHRIHDQPDPEKISELEDSLRLAGFQVHDLNVRQHLCQLLSEIAGSSHAHAWNTAILRSMRKAEYSESCIGHYGLAKRHYTHFTSPIRRYPDLVVHRILKAYLQKKKPLYTQAQLSEIAKQCSEREIIATKAERDVKDLKILRFFYEQLESGKLEEYEAVVVGVESHGLFIDLPEVLAYGMIHKSLLGDSVYFNSLKKQFSGRGKNAMILKIGSSLKVVIAKVDLEKRFLDFAPVDSRNEKSLTPPKKRKRFNTAR